MEGGAASTMSDVITAMSTGLTSMTSDVLDGIADIVPIALPIFGVGIVIVVIRRVYKQLTGR